MKKDIVIVENFDENPISFNMTGWFNATEAGRKFGKKPYEFLRLPTTEEYVIELHKNYSTFFEENQELPQIGTIPICEPSKIIKQFVKTKRGTKSPGTWFHPRLGIVYARWLSPRFAVWCDFQIERIIAQSHPQQGWFKERQNAAASFQAMCFALKFKAEREGKELENYHYSNEALLVNEVLTGKREPIDWDVVNDKELLKLRNKVLNVNSALISAGTGYAERRDFLRQWIKTNGNQRISCKAVERP